ncbi:MAG: aldo/keto reductase, partial [Candidatus Dormibacteria bacterium]
MSRAPGMERRPLGRSGPPVSVVGLGTNSFGSRMPDDAVGPVVTRALDCGINLFDTADVYGAGESERLLGLALRGRRREALIATKFGKPMRGGDPNQPRRRAQYIRDAAEASLRRLGTDVIDLYLMHKPDSMTPIAESMGALGELVEAGKVRWIGCSNFSSHEVEEAQTGANAHRQTSFTCAQDEYSLLSRDAERELLPTLDRLGMRLLPYFP